MTARTSQQTGRTVRFTITGAALPKERVRARIVTPKGKRPFVQLYTPKETRAYEERIQKLARRAWGDAEPSLRPIELQAVSYTHLRAHET